MSVLFAQAKMFLRKDLTENLYKVAIGQYFEK